MQGTYTLWKINTLAFLIFYLQFQIFIRASLSVLLCSCRAHTAPKKNGGESGNMNSCALNKHCAFRQFSFPKPPLLLAANRQAVKKHNFSSLSI
jgi:hypothetical protein